MLNNFRINYAEGKIIVSKKVAKKAEIYGTAEYLQLQEVRKDYPHFTIEFEEKKNSKRDYLKGLTYDFMRNYILNHDPTGQLMNDFKILLGESDIAKELEVDGVSYGQIRSWFLMSFPEIEKFCEAREKILSKKAA